MLYVVIEISILSTKNNPDSNDTINLANDIRELNANLHQVCFTIILF